MKLFKRVMLWFVVGLLPLFLQGAQVAPEHQTFDANRLKNNAEVEGFGYKTSNLVELNRVAENLPTVTEGKTTIQVRVPVFLGIPSNAVRALFEANGFDLETEWQTTAVGELAGLDSLAVLKDQTRREAFYARCTALVERIEQVALTKGRDAFLKAKHRLFDKTIAEYLDNASDSNWRLMVRSTGKEDTKELPNAGGNHSEPNVSPNLEAVLAGLKKVVASYFKPKSLEQRRTAGDKTLFDTPLCPVLLQRMIGEPISGAKQVRDVPVGCVVYSAEPEGKTENVVVVQGSWGNNEGVVNNEVGIDTYFVRKTDGDKRSVTSVVVNKPYRVVPMKIGEKFGLQMVANEGPLADLVNKPIMNDEEASCIARVAEEVGRYYKNEPMDIELVYDRRAMHEISHSGDRKRKVYENIVYLVQARPLQQADVTLASYVATVDDITPEKFVSCMPVGSGGGAVRIITTKDQIVVAETLAQALEMYQGLANPGVVEAAIAGSADPTSHPAAVFRGAGKAILVAADEGGRRVKGWLDAGNRLLVDVQRGMIIDTIQVPALANDLAALREAGAVKAGWIRHPAVQRMRLTKKPALFQVRPAVVDAEYARKELSELIELLKSGDVAAVGKATYALAARLGKFVELADRRVEQAMANKAADLPVLKVVADHLKKIFATLTHLVPEIEATAGKPAYDMTRLYFAAQVEALVQQKEAPKFVGGYSIASIDQQLEQELKFVATLDQLIENKEQLGALVQNRRLFLCCMEGYDAAFAPELSDAWVKAVVTLDKITSKALVAMWEMLKLLEVDTAWINVSFARQNNISTLVGELEKIKTDLMQLREQRAKLEKFEISLFDKPANFGKQFKKLNAIVDDFKTEAFFEWRKKSNGLLTLVALSSMELTVNVFDLSIKQVKGSPAYSSDEKLNCFKNMLKQYYDLLVRWVAFIPEDQKILLQAKSSTIEEYLHMLSKIIIDKTFSSEDLEPTSGLDASVFAMGCGHDFVQDSRANIQPSTGEDAYTITHQSLLNVCTLLTTSLKDKITIPPLIEQLASSFDSGHTARMQPKKLTGITIKKEGIAVLYNVPLGSHSLQIALLFNAKENNVTMELRFFGGLKNEAYRWVNCAAMMMMYRLCFGLPVEINKLHHHALSVKIIMNEENRILLDKMAPRIYEVIKTGAAVDIDFMAEWFKDRPLSPEIDSISMKLRKTGELGLWAELIVFKVILKTNHVPAFKLAIAAARLGMESEDYNVRQAAFDLFRALFEKGQGFKEAIVAGQEGMKSKDGYVVNDARALWKALVAQLTVLTELVKRGECFSEAVVAAKAAMESQDDRIRLPAVALWKALVAQLTVLTGLVKKGECFSEAIAVAWQGMKSKDANVWLAALDLFRALVEKNKGFDEAIKAALEGMESKDGKVQRVALALWEVLVENGKDFDKAIVAAQTGIKSADTQYAALGLFRALFDKGKGFDEAITAAQAGMKSKDDKVQMVALALWKALVGKGEGFKEAIKAAQLGMESEDDNVRQAALDLFRALFEKGQGFDEAITAAQAGMESTNDKVRRAALVLWKALVENDKNFDEAIKAAQNGMYSQDDNVRATALDLWNALFAKDQGFKTAIAAVQKGEQSIGYGVRKIVLALWKALFEKGHGFDQAIAAAQLGMESEDDDVRQAAFDLFRALFENDKGFDEAIEAVQTAMKSRFYLVKQVAFDLLKALFVRLKALVGKGEGFKEVIKAAQIGIKSEDYGIRQAALDLWRVLFEKGQGFESAIAAAQEGMKSEDDKVRFFALALWKMLVARLEILVSEGKALDIAKKAIEVGKKVDALNKVTKKLQLRIFGKYKDEEVEEEIIEEVELEVVPAEGIAAAVAIPEPATFSATMAFDLDDELIPVDAP